jgi:hypothetical protein
MTLRGHIQNGTVVLDEPAELPEGTCVRIELVNPEEDDFASLRAGLLRVSGTVHGLPEDLAENHDYYIHGKPIE